MKLFLLLVAFVVGASMAEDVYDCPPSGSGLQILRYCHRKEDPRACHIYCAPRQPRSPSEEESNDCPQQATAFAVLRHCRHHRDFQACIDDCSSQDADRLHRAMQNNSPTVILAKRNN